MEIARVSGSAALCGGHTTLKLASSIRTTIHPFFSCPRNAIFFKPNISTIAVRFRSFPHRRWKEKRKYSTDSKFLCGFALSADSGYEYSDGDFVVVNFYRFVYIEDPEHVVAKHLSFLQGRDIHGRIYVNEQGINAQYSGPCKDAMAYTDWLKEDVRVSDILVQISPALNGHAFPRLKLRWKGVSRTFLCLIPQRELHH